MPVASIKIKTIFVVALALVAISFPSFAQDKSQARTKIRFGVVTGRGPVEVIKQWQPLMKYLDSNGFDIEIVLRESYHGLLESLKKGEIDLVEGGAFLYVQMHEEAGAKILVGEERIYAFTENAANYSTYYLSYIISNADKNFNALSDLKGHSFAFTDPDSTTGYMWPRLMLADADIEDPQKYFSSIIFTNNHDSSVNAILNKSVDAAAVASFNILLRKPEERAKIRILATSEPISTGPITYRRDLDENTVRRLRELFLNFHNRVPPEELLQTTIHKFVMVDDSFYDTIRAGFERIKSLPKMSGFVRYRTAPRQFYTAFDRHIGKGILLISIPILSFIAIVVLLFLIFRKKFAARLRIKLIFAFISISIVILTILSASVIFDMRTKVHKMAGEYLWNIETFEAACATAAANRNTDVLSTYTDDFARRRDVIYTKIIQNGIYQTDSTHKDVGANMATNVMNGTFYLSSTSKEPMIEVLDPILIGDEQWGLAQVGFSLKGVQKIIMNAIIANILTIVVSIALSILMAYLFAAHITRPLQRLIAATQDIRRGRSRPIGIKSSDEIGALARSIEQMRIELADKDELIQSKLVEMDEKTSPKSKRESPADAQARYEEADELRQKIAEIEVRTPRLKELRHEAIIGESPAFLKTIRDIVIRSRDSGPALIYGESGSGKTGIARAIHQLSDRADKPFGEFNCAEFASADPLIVLGKLFGYGRDCGIQGIAREGQPGLLQKYNGATLFLDEVNSLPLHAQALLLLPLEGRSFSPAAGRGDHINVDVRFIFASNAPLADEVSAGRFRKDLLRRLHVRGYIEIPPLRNRTEDIPVLAEHFLMRWCRDKDHKMTISSDAMEILISLKYEQFNVGELLSVIQVAADNAYFDNQNEILSKHLTFGVTNTHAMGSVGASVDRPSSNIPEWADATEAEEIAALRKFKFRISETEAYLGYPKNSKTLTNHFRGICYKALALSDWNIEKVAAGLSSGCSERLSMKVKQKVRQYCDGLMESINTGSEDKLLNNLLQKYFTYIDAAKNTSDTKPFSGKKRGILFE